MIHFSLYLGVILSCLLIRMENFPIDLPCIVKEILLYIYNNNNNKKKKKNSDINACVPDAQFAPRSSHSLAS